MWFVGRRLGVAGVSGAVGDVGGAALLPGLPGVVVVSPHAGAGIAMSVFVSEGLTDGTNVSNGRFGFLATKEGEETPETTRFLWGGSVRAMTLVALLARGRGTEVVGQRFCSQLMVYPHPRLPSPGGLRGLFGLGDGGGRGGPVGPADEDHPHEGPRYGAQKGGQGQPEGVVQLRIYEPVIVFVAGDKNHDGHKRQPSWRDKDEANTTRELKER